jgi:hypothetical protein
MGTIVRSVLRQRMKVLVMRIRDPWQERSVLSECERRRQDRDRQRGGTVISSLNVSTTSSRSATGSGCRMAPCGHRPGSVPAWT